MSPVLDVAWKRTVEMCAVFMMGNGIVGMTQPQRQVSLWRSEVTPVDALVRRFDGHPNKRRLQGLWQFGLGFFLATRMRRKDR